jgi:two-component system CheB/CheR fusion protein
MPLRRTSQFAPLLDAFLEQSPDHALIFFGADECIVWANSGAENIFGVRAADLVGRNTRDFFTPEDVEMGMPAHELAIARSRGSSEDDRWMMRPDGSRFWGSGNAYSLQDKEGSLIGYGKLIQNRTPSREQVLALKNQIVDHASKDERKNGMISTFGHELRGPLTPLMNAVELLRAGSTSEYPIALIERQIHFIGRLIDDLMEATTAHVGKLQLHIENLVLQDVLSQAVDAVRSAAGLKGQQLDVLLPPGALQLRGDAVRLQQVFANLLVNALKYTPRGGRIWVKAMAEGQEVVVRVEDNGIGIAPELLSDIFELFVQVHTPKSHEGGAGIGLSLVKDLVALHGGTVQANSDGIGKGSEFIVRLPAEVKQRAAKAPERSLPVPKEATLG